MLATDIDLVKSLIEQADEDTGGDFLHELKYASKGSIMDELQSLEDYPEGWVVSVHEVSTEVEYDSYGNSHTDSAYVIIEVTDLAKNSALYMIPGEYASYNGWEWYISRISRVEKREKVVKTFEWNKV